MAVITASSPKRIEKIFPHWWLARIAGDTINPSTPEQSFTLAFVFIRGNRLENGNWELSPFADDVKSVTIKDVFEFAANEANNGNNQPGELLDGLVSIAGAIAKNAGVID